MNHSGRHNKIRVAIAKSRIYKGGVFQVIEGIAEVLNDMGITPDVITLKTNISQSDISENYEGRAALYFKEISTNLKLPYEWHFLFFNAIARRYLTDYDLIINSNNTCFLAGGKRPRLTYVHYPRKGRVLSPLRSTHFPEGPNKSFVDIGTDPFWLARLLYQNDTRSHDNEILVANSEFTKSALLNNYSKLSAEYIRVIYPPVNIPKDLPEDIEKNNTQVASLGRFSPEKRQLEQIEIARMTPELDFHLIGFVGIPAYLEKCRNYIRENGIQNVTLHPDAPYGKVQDLLRSSRFFLHNVRNEPFGITSVQAIARGSIPVVHNSGGQREVVPSPELRFHDAQDAQLKLKALSSTSHTELAAMQQGLFDHIQRFSAQEFRKSMRQALEEAIALL